MSWFYSCFLFLVTPVECMSGCKCRYDQTESINIFHCSESTTSMLPMTIPYLTQWVIITNSKVQSLCGIYSYFNESSTVTRLSITLTNLTMVCEATLAKILKTPNIKYLDLANNNLRNLPHLWLNQRDYFLEKLWLGGNPIECQCEMFWLVDWLRNSTNSSGQKLVQDYMNVTCTYGQAIGTPIYKLTQVSMGCYPKNIPKWIIVAATCIGAVILTIVVNILLIHHYRLLIRWLIYKKFDKLVGDPDRNEDITQIEFGAFLSFRYIRY